MVRVSIEAPKGFAQELLTFFHASALSARDYRMKMLSLSSCKCICGISLRNNLCVLKQHSLSVTSKSQHEQKKRHDFNTKTSLQVLKTQLFLAKEQRVFIRSKLPNVGNSSVSEKPEQTDVL